jgi:hypothetical protein
MFTVINFKYASTDHLINWSKGDITMSYFRDICSKLKSVGLIVR